MDNITKNIILAPFNLLYAISPALTLKILFRLKNGYPLDLDDPKTYNEKLQWIKLYNRDPLMTRCCDKFFVRDYVRRKGCGETLNELIWAGYDPSDIPFNTLPEKCVIKVTHGSTFNIICTDSERIDKHDVIRKCNRWLNAKFIPCYGEWFYGKIRPRVIVERFIESDGPLKDYKVFCFNGEPKMIRVDTDRFTNHKMAFYDCDWNRIKGVEMGYPESDEEIEKPECLNELLGYARKLSEPFLHARVDFYINDNKIIFGEITFTNGAGFDRIRPREFDRQMGDWLHLEGK